MSRIKERNEHLCDFYLGEAETDQAREESGEIMDINHNGEGKFEKNGEHETHKLHEGFLKTDHVILNHGQVAWTTPQLAPPSPNYHTTPTGGRFIPRQI
ncbi:hypothetical protein TNCV_2592891 [Trichonephila clavipes]|nr:hypothetical protein TNCV_2592891 [Trichonephila clavipes]